jgi:hypothetical protein
MMSLINFYITILSDFVHLIFLFKNTFQKLSIRLHTTVGGQAHTQLGPLAWLVSTSDSGNMYLNILAVVTTVT